MNFFVRWHQEHSLLFELILFFLACLVSVFSSRIYSFITEWPGKKLRERRRELLEDELNLLRRIHNNVYELNLYVYRDIADALNRSLLYGAAFAVVTSLVIQKPSPYTFVAISVGIMIGQISNIGTTITRLQHYDDAVANLSAELAKYSSPPEVKAASGKMSD